MVLKISLQDRMGQIHGCSGMADCSYPSGIRAPAVDTSWFPSVKKKQERSLVCLPYHK